MNIEIKWPVENQPETFTSKRDPSTGQVVYTVKSRVTGTYTVSSTLFA